MKKTALIILGVVKIILGILLLSVGAGHGALVSILGVVWIVVAIAQNDKKANSNKTIQEIVDSPGSPQVGSTDQPQGGSASSSQDKSSTKYGKDDDLEVY